MKEFAFVILSLLYGCNGATFYEPPQIDTSSYPRMSVFVNSADMHERMKLEKTISARLERYQTRPIPSMELKRSSDKVVERSLHINLIDQSDFSMSTPGVAFTDGQITQSPYGNTTYSGITTYGGGGSIPVRRYQYEAMLLDMETGEKLWSMMIVVTSRDRDWEENMARKIDNAIEEDKVLELRPPRFLLWEPRR